MYKTKEELLALAVRQYDEVDGFRLQSLTELEVSELDAKWGKRFRDTKEVDLVMRRELLALCLVEADGSRMFRDDEVEAMGGLPSQLTAKLYRKARDLCGMNEDKEDSPAKN